MTVQPLRYRSSKSWFGQLSDAIVTCWINWRLRRQQAKDVSAVDLLQWIEAFKKGEA
jgi:hypothetical protein